MSKFTLVFDGKSDISVGIEFGDITPPAWTSPSLSHLSACGNLADNTIVCEIILWSVFFLFDTLLSKGQLADLRC